MRFWLCMLSVWLFWSPAPSMAAQASSPAAQAVLTTCGVEGDIILPGDGTLCEEDIAFGMLYEMFPSLFNELMPLWDLTAFSDLGKTPNVPMLLGEYRGDQVFFSLFSLFYKLTLFCVLTYSGVLAFSILMRWLKGDRLIDNRSHKESPASLATGVGVGGAFMVPYKGFFIGQMAVFTLGIVALSMANFLSSLFLSGNQQLFIAMSSKVERESVYRPSNVVDRHDYLSDVFYRNLTRNQLCRRQSGDYILSGIGGGFTDAGAYRAAAACATPSATLVQPQNGGASAPGFIWTETSMSTSSSGGEVFFSGSTEVRFASRGQTLQSCQVNGEAPPDYDCGSFEVLSPDWSKNPLVRLYGDQAGSFVAGHMSALQKQVSPSQSPSNIESALANGWSAMRAQLIAKFQESWLEASESGAMKELVSVDDKVMKRSDALRAAMMDNARPHLQQAAQFYYQSAMNMLMFGSEFKYRKQGEEQPSSSGADWSPLTYYAGVADRFAELTSRVQCMNYRYDLHKSEETARFLRGEAETLNADSMARCVDVLKGEVLEFDPEYATKTKEQIRADATARYEALSKQLAQEWRKSVSALSAQRRAIEKGFEAAVSEETSGQWWVALRQQGYLAAADYAQSMNNRVNGYKRDLKLVLNNFLWRSGTFDARYISNDLDAAYSVDANFQSFRDMGDKALAATRVTQGRIDPLISDAQWIVEQENLLREDPTGLDDSVFDMISRMVTMPRGYLERLGIGLSPGSKDQEKCLSNPSYCPFPLTDPLVELSLMGHDMVDVSVAFYAAGVPIKLATGAWMEKARLKNAPKGQVSPENAMDRLEKSLNGNGPAGKTIGALFAFAKGALSTGTALLDLAFDLFSPIMAAFLGVGLVLAYLLPLLPKIYLYLNFISWLSVVVMSSFAVLLWSLFWVRFTEKHDLLKSAGLHFGVELLFKPSFSLISVIFAWYFFYVVAYAVGVSLGWIFILPFDEANFLRSVLDTAIVVILICFIYFVGLKYAYQLMSDMTGELLKRLGVNDSKQQEKISDMVKAILYDHASRLARQGTDALDRNAGRDAGKRYLMNRARQAQSLSQQHNQSYQNEMARLRQSQHGGQ